MRRVWIIALLAATFSTLTILGAAWGTVLDWPDYLHVSYGFPMNWATHTLSTIAGPVDIWRVDISTLIIDLVFWLGTMTIALAVTIRLID